MMVFTILHKCLWNNLRFADIYCRTFIYTKNTHLLMDFQTCHFFALSNHAQCHVSFILQSTFLLCWKLFKIWPLIETNLNFYDLWPLNHRSDKEVTMNTFSYLTLSNTLAWSVLLLNYVWIWPFNSDHKWPQDDLQSKIPEHPERTPGQGSVHSSFINIYWIM